MEIELLEGSGMNLEDEVVAPSFDSSFFLRSAVLCVGVLGRLRFRIFRESLSVLRFI